MSNFTKKNIKGAAMIEYILIVSLVAIAAVTAFTDVGTAIGTKITAIVGNLK